MVKNLPANASDAGFLGQEDALEEEMTTHSSILPDKFHGQRSLMSISPWDGQEWDMTERLALSFFSLRGKDCGSIRRILQIIKTPPPSLRKHLQAWRSSQDGLQWK